MSEYLTEYGGRPSAGPFLAHLAAILLFTTATFPAFALSEIKREELPPAESQPDGGAVEIIPLPENEGNIAEEPEEPAGVENPKDFIVSDLPDPQILTDLALLPAPARRMRELILEACAEGDIEALRPLIGTGANITQLSLGGLEGDPVDFLRDISGDGEGHEILAILQEVLEAGFVHLDAGTPRELYVWPYFFAYPLHKLDPKQRVALFRIVTAGDYEDMVAFGGYNFFRAGISPEGQWVFFVAGD
ncbi:MAG: hypothetical protein AB3N20_16135 [Rhizobiaceae bacterium]